MLKTCSKCSESKPLEDFYPAKDTPSGRKARCKACCRTEQRRFQAEHKERTGAWKTHTYTYERQCEFCGKNFTTKTSKARFCSNTCGNLGRRWTLICHGCGGSWEAPAPTSFWCSDPCRVLDEQVRRARFAQVAVWERPERWVHPKYIAPVLKPLRKRWYVGQCACCESWFIHDQPTTMTCSPRCMKKISKANYRAAKKAAFVAPVSPRKIFERDGWKCRLCGKPVKRGAVAPHPKAPVIDHIVPLEPLPGQPRGTHEPANVQCAHFLCNSIKGNRGGGEQLLLIG